MSGITQMWPTLAKTDDARNHRWVRLCNGVEGKLVHLDYDTWKITVVSGNRRFVGTPSMIISVQPAAQGGDGQTIKRHAARRAGTCKAIAAHLQPSSAADRMMKQPALSSMLSAQRREDDMNRTLDTLWPRPIVDFVSAFAQLDEQHRLEVVRWVPLAMTFDDDEINHRPSIEAAWHAVDVVEPLFELWRQQFDWENERGFHRTFDVLDCVREGLVHISGRCAPLEFCSWCHSEHEADRYLDEQLAELTS